MNWSEHARRFNPDLKTLSTSGEKPSKGIEMFLEIKVGQILLIGDETRVAFVSIDDGETVTLQVESPLYPSVANELEAVADLELFVAGDGA